MVIAFVVISGCAELSPLTKLDGRGYYIFPDDKIEVKAPANLAVHDGKTWVGFVLGAGYWMADGQYAVYLYDIPQGIESANDFYNQSESFLRSFQISLAAIQ